MVPPLKTRLSNEKRFTVTGKEIRGKTAPKHPTVPMKDDIVAILFIKQLKTT